MDQTNGQTVRSGPSATVYRGRSQLVLSLFPGADLLGRGFEQAGYCVVRGPDALWGQDVRAFSLVSHSFAGIIGGSPCQGFSKIRRGRVGDAAWQYSVEMLNQFCRLVTEGSPDWFLLENVAQVPTVTVDGYTVQRFNVRATECGMTQNRLRSFQFGSKTGVPLVIRRQPLRAAESHCCLATEGKRTNRRSWPEFCALQGLPADFALPDLSTALRYKLVGNGVPLPMGKLIAEAIRDRGTVCVPLCRCECGRPVTGKQTLATAGCRKRMQRKRDAAAVSGPGPVTSGMSQLF